MSKCRVLTLSKKTLEGLEDWCSQAERCDELFKAGRPYSTEGDDVDFESGGSSVPGGRNLGHDGLCETLSGQDQRGAGPVGQLITKAQLGQRATLATNVLQHHCAAAKAAHLLLLLRQSRRKQQKTATEQCYQRLRMSATSRWRLRTSATSKSHCPPCKEARGSEDWHV